MELVSPQALAGLLRREKAALLDAWEAYAKHMPHTEPLSVALLRDRIPALLDELAHELEQPEAARGRLREFSAEHGQHRQQVGMHLPQIVQEYKLLRRCIVMHAEAHGLVLSGQALRIVNEIIDEGIEAAIAAYIERRDAGEKQRRDEYLKFIVHDLRSPLAANYYAILLAEREVDRAGAGERIRTIHDAIKRNIERMRALVDRLLEEERNVRTPQRLEIERETVELWSIVHSAIRTLGALAAGARTRIVNRVPAGLTLHADPELIERVLQNLIANAIRHTEGGRVEIGAAGRLDGAVDCWVTDNGSGMPEEVRARTIEAAAAGTNRTGGGLGLALVKRLVEAHGGAIDVQSEPSRGTTVRFSIPPG